MGVQKLVNDELNAHRNQRVSMALECFSLLCDNTNEILYIAIHSQLTSFIQKYCDTLMVKPKLTDYTKYKYITKQNTLNTQRGYNGIKWECCIAWS